MTHWLCLERSSPPLVSRGVRPPPSLKDQRISSDAITELRKPRAGGLALRGVGFGRSEGAGQAAGAELEHVGGLREG
jgi:hypothetical protein